MRRTIEGGFRSRWGAWRGSLLGVRLLFDVTGGWREGSWADGQSLSLCDIQIRRYINRCICSLTHYNSLSHYHYLSH